MRVDLKENFDYPAPSIRFDPARLGLEAPG